MKLAFVLLLVVLHEWVSADVSHVAHNNVEHQYLPPHPTAKARLSVHYLTPEEVKKKTDILERQYLPPEPPKRKTHHGNEDGYKYGKGYVYESHASKSTPYSEQQHHMNVQDRIKQTQYKISRPTALEAVEATNRPRSLLPDLPFRPPYRNLFTPAADPNNDQLLGSASSPNSVFHTQINVQSQDNRFNVPNTLPRANGRLPSFGTVGGLGATSGINGLNGAGGLGLGTLEGNAGLVDPSPDELVSLGGVGGVDGLNGESGLGESDEEARLLNDAARILRVGGNSRTRTDPNANLEQLARSALTRTTIPRQRPSTDEQVRLLNALAGARSSQRGALLLESIRQNPELLRAFAGTLPNTDLLTAQLLANPLNGERGRSGVPATSGLRNRAGQQSAVIDTATLGGLRSTLLQNIADAEARILSAGAADVGGNSSSLRGRGASGATGMGSQLSAARNVAFSNVDALSRSIAGVRGNPARGISLPNTLRRSELLESAPNQRQANNQALNLIGGNVPADEVTSLALLSRAREGNNQGVNIINGSVSNRVATNSRPRQQQLSLAVSDLQALLNQAQQELDFVPNASAPEVIYTPSGDFDYAASGQTVRKAKKEPHRAEHKHATDAVLRRDGYHYDKPSKTFNN